MDNNSLLAIEAMRSQGVQGRPLHWSDTVEAVWHTADKNSGLEQGDYLTLQPQDNPATVPTDRYDPLMAKLVARALRTLLPDSVKHPRKTLVVGLGNADYTCDALGAMTVKQLGPTPTRMVFCPSVQRHTGIATADLLQGVVRQTAPQVVLAIDALACSDTKHLCRTVQLSNAGLCPGGGVYQQLAPIGSRTLGVPVLYVGIPLISRTPHQGLCVTPTNIDELLPRLAAMLACGIARIV